SMTAVPIEIRGNHPYVRASATVGGTAESGLFVLDTGSNSSVIFTPGVARSRKLAERMKNTITARAGGVGGEFEMIIGRIDSVALGGFTIEQPVGLFPESGQFAASEAIGNLGGQILRRFRAVFDYPHRRL